MPNNPSPNFIPLALVLCAAAILISWPDFAFAVQADDIFCTMSRWFTGGLGKAIGTIVVTTLGVQALLGRVSWGMAVMISLGIASMFGAVTIVSALTGITNPDENICKKV